jgi:hypothetical protein
MQRHADAQDDIDDRERPTVRDRRSAHALKPHRVGVVIGLAVEDLEFPIMCAIRNSTKTSPVTAITAFLPIVR